MALRAALRARADRAGLSDDELFALANAAYKRTWVPNPESVTLASAWNTEGGNAEA